MIHLYNHTKFPVDIEDNMIQHFSFSPRTKRWPVRIFTHLIDIACINAMVLFMKHYEIDKNKLNDGFRKTFLRKLGDQLMENQMELREEQEPHNYIYSEFKMVYNKIEDLHNKFMGFEKDKTPKNLHCKICKNQRNSINFSICNQCNNFVCTEHIAHICASCLENKAPNFPSEPVFLYDNCKKLIF